MIYHIEAYDKEESISQIVEFESNKLFKGEYAICDRLNTFIDLKAKELVIPEGVTTLGVQAFYDDSIGIGDKLGKTLELPSSLTEIDDNAFTVSSFQQIRIAPENTSFVVKDGALYTMDLKRLIYILISADASNEFWVPEETMKIDGCALNCARKIHIPDSVEYISWDQYCLTEIIAPKESYAIRFAREYGAPYEIEES